MNTMQLMKQGKVRDIYAKGDNLVLVTTDRHSSFDRVIATIPRKGEVLNKLSLWWFNQLANIVPNHVLSIVDDRSVEVIQTQPLPIEVIVRGYITGVTKTSLWTSYKDGKRDYGDFQLPDGLIKNQKLSQSVLTPTTKSDLGDENLSSSEIIEQGLLSEELWKNVSDIAIKLFQRGSELAWQRGLILVDTKYEFGLDASGRLLLIDEVHTPDSSRFWYADTYEESFRAGQDPRNFDKEFLRKWFSENCRPYEDEVLPEAPMELVQELSSRYLQIYEQITGEKL